MSKITLTPNASGTGTFNIQSPNSNTDRTFTLPDKDGELSVGSSFAYDAVTGATQDLDLDVGNFFDAGNLTADTTLTFSNLPTEAKWSYTAIADILTGYALEDASYDSVSFDISSQSGYPTGIFFKPDGTKMYVADTFNGVIRQYSLSTAWDISTLSYDSKTLSIRSQGYYAYQTSFKSDGTKVYVVGRIGAGGSGDAEKIYQYSLSTAWDLSTASYDSKSLDLIAQDNVSAGMFFKPDGSTLFTTGRQNNAVYQYDLSTAWDVSTGSFTSPSFDISGQFPASTSETLVFKPDGTRMFIVGTNEIVAEYSLSTPWTISTAAYAGVTFDVSSQDATALGLAFKDDGSKMYMSGGTNDTIFQYSTGGGVAITLPASVQNPPTLDTDPNQRFTYDFYTADGGTNVYLIGEEIT